MMQVRKYAPPLFFSQSVVKKGVKFAEAKREMYSH